MRMYGVSLLRFCLPACLPPSILSFFLSPLLTGSRRRRRCSLSLLFDKASRLLFAAKRAKGGRKRKREKKWLLPLSLSKLCLHLFHPSALKRSSMHGRRFVMYETKAKKATAPSPPSPFVITFSSFLFLFRRLSAPNENPLLPPFSCERAIKF